MVRKSLRVGRVAKRHAGHHFLPENFQEVSKNCGNQFVLSDVRREEKNSPVGSVMIDATFGYT